MKSRFRAARPARRNPPKARSARGKGSQKVRVRTVYLSYSWDSAIHKDWVSKFAFRLKANGVEVVVDQWSLSLGEHIARFMDKAVERSDFVLLICTPKYKKRADRGEGGVGYEQDLMIAERLVARSYDKFIPVLREGDPYSALPKWIASHLAVDLRGDKYEEGNFQNLVEHLLHAPIPRRRGEH